MGKKLQKLSDYFKSFEVNVPVWTRIMLGVLLLSIIATSIILPLKSCGSQEEQFPEVDENTYLYEEVSFAKEIFVKCVGINVTQDENDKYILNLLISIEQWNTKNDVEEQEFSSDMFQLRLVDINAPSKMSVFVNCLAQATLSALLTGAVDGSINVLEETLGFAADYVSSSIENAISKKENVIKSAKGQFNNFYPHENNGITRIEQLSFELNDTFLNSNNVMVLSIDTWNRAEKNIFLVLRPNMKDYTVELDLNGGESNLLPDKIDISAGEIVELPQNIPRKEGSKFVCWTTEKDNKATKVRDFYFPTQEENSTIKVFAYYQPLIPLDEFSNINEMVQFKDGAITLAVTNYFYTNQITVKTKKNEDVSLTPAKGKKYVGLDIVINKNKTGNNHTLDNKNDFYMVNSYTGKSIKDYYGYTKFSSMKPIDDYSWIGVKNAEVGTYEFTMYFEINEEWYLNEKLLILEIDFFAGKNAQSILLQ